MHRYVQLFALLTFPIAIFSKVVDICIFGEQAQQCPQPAFYGRYRDQNLIHINTDLIAVLDTSTGNKATKLRLPGNYKLVFGEVIVNTDLDFMFSDIRMELDVPGFGKLNALPTCDNQSHVASVEGIASQYCRYCDICDLTANAEDKLQQSKVIEVEKERFGENCHKLRRGYRYTWGRNIAVPGPEEFQRKYNGQVDKLLENALLNGKGNLNVKIRLLNKVTNPGNTFQKGSCILNCTRQSSNTKCQRFPWLEDCISQPCVTQCQAQANAFELQNGRGDCQTSVDHLEGFELAGCYDIQFQYEAKEPISPTQDSCPKAGNPCKNEKRYCCGCTHCGRYGLSCSQECMTQTPESCEALFT